VQQKFIINFWVSDKVKIHEGIGRAGGLATRNPRRTTAWGELGMSAGCCRKGGLSHEDEDEAEAERWRGSRLWGGCDIWKRLCYAGSTARRQVSSRWT